MSAQAWDGPPSNGPLTAKLDTSSIWLVFISTFNKVKKKMRVSGRQVTAARDLLGITQAELAAAAGLSRLTIVKFEAGHAEPYPANLAKITAELERRGIEFTNGDGAGVRINYAKAAEFARLSAQSRNNVDR